MLIEEIIAAESTLEAVESTCRQIRKTATFLPAIGEFMKVLKEQDELWDVRFGGIWHSQSTYEELQFLRDDLEELNRRGVRTGQNGLRDLERNARVWHRKLGPGIVLGPNSDGTVCVNFTAKKSLNHVFRATLALESAALEHKPVETLVVGAKVPVSVGGDDEF